MNAPTWLKLVWEKIVTAVAPTASSGGGGGAEAVELSAGDFPLLYSNFGYDFAISRDSASQSYVAELSPKHSSLHVKPTRKRSFYIMTTMQPTRERASASMIW